MKFERFIRVSTGRAVLKGLFLVALIFLIESTDFAFAQLGEGEWGEPLNVSRSGATDKPQIVVDSQGVVHLLWQDTIEGYYYSSGDGETWSQPRLVDLPFGISDSNEELSVGGRHLLYEPVIAADNSNRLHAFWRDGNDALFYSSVSANDVAALSEWQQSQQLAESALDVDSDIDGRGRIHIAYVRALDSPGLPSGIYYRRSINRGETWSLPRLLYETPYFRRLNTESANVRIVSTEQDNVVVAWDDRPQERVYVARSVDAGNTWKEPTEIDRRLSSDAINAVGPSRVSVSGHNDQVHLIWMAGHDGQQCSQYTQFSADGGATWQDRQQITGLEGICADESQFIVTGDGRFLLSLETPSGTLISTWTDQVWTQPSIQMTLTSFVNPDTFRPVELACKKFATAGITGDEPHMRLMVVGCDRGVGEDIWYLSADLSTIVDIEGDGQTSIWRRETEIVSGTQIGTIWLAEDSSGTVYAQWNQEEADSISFFQSVLTGELWSPPQEILQIAMDNLGSEPSLFLGRDDVLTAVWTDGNPGELLVRQAYASPNLSQLDWSSADEIPVTRAAASSPYLSQDPDGNYWMAYSIPLNEDRGIYLTMSGNGGLDWTTSQQVFDGIAAGWEMVDRPILLVDHNGIVHLMWAQYSSPPDAEILSLVYIRSEDGGSSWLEPVVVSNAPAGWADFAVTRDGLVHRLWSDKDGILWQEYSADEGNTWTTRIQLTSVTDNVEVATVADDELGSPQLLAVVTEGDSTNPSPRLLHWSWNGSEWDRADSLNPNLNTVLGISGLVKNDGDLETIFSGSVSALEDGQRLLVSTGRQLDEAMIALDLPPAVTPEVVENPSPTTEVEPVATPTALVPGDLGSVANLPGPSASGGIFSGPVLGIVLSAAIVGVVLIVSIRFLQNRRW